jgi:phosphoribosyl 1,2-cyclic phosphate phosphodiesterase
MTITFLGTGTSTGVPEVGCQCRVCTSSDLCDNRFRSSVFVETGGKNLLIDCAPDFRQQMLRLPFIDRIDRIDAVLLTHEHYDHVGGIDDLRTFCKHGAVPVYAEASVSEAIRERLPYVFRKNKYPGVPNIELHDIENLPFEAADIQVTPIRLMHGALPIFGFRTGNFAYLTDLKTIPESEYKKLENLDVLVINALRDEEHIAHQTIAEAIAQAERIRAKRTFFTHFSHRAGLHSELCRRLPENIFPACDNLSIEI